MESKTKIAISVIIVILVVGGGFGIYHYATASKKTQEVVVYADYSPSLAGPFFNAFTNQTGIKVVPVYGSMGTLIGKLIASKGSEQADVMFGGAPSAYIQAENQSVFQSYTPSAIANQSAYIGNHVLWRDPSWNWYPFTYATLGLSINYKVIQNSSDPTNFTQLLNSQFNGKILLENPSTSTTTGIAFYSMVWQYYDLHYGNTTGKQMFTTYMRALFNNSITHYMTDDEDAETAIGTGTGAMTLDWSYMPVLYDQQQGYTLKPQLLNQTVLGPTAMAMVNGAPNSSAAKTFINWVESSSGQQQIINIFHKPPILSGMTVPAGSYSLSQLLSSAFPYSQTFTSNNANYIDSLFTTYGGT